MVCYHPLKGWADKSNPKGITFNKKQGYEDLARTVPCGNCIGCRLERSRQWAVRCHHEASLHENNSFITLTYDQEPEDGSVSVRELQLFMKRLRKKYDYPIRFFACGEYGDLLDRPHYHACLFGHDFQDKYFWKMSSSGEKIYRSPELETVWTLGFSSTGTVTFKSAAYVARYQLKKITGSRAEDHYRGKTPEFLTMSRRPGIGAKWLRKYEDDVYSQDFVIINQKKARPPRFYDNNIKTGKLDQVKRRRKKGLRQHNKDNTPERLAVREKIQLKKAELLKREIK